MRMIHIANENNRDTNVSFDVYKKEEKVKFVLKDGSSRKNTKILKATINEDLQKLLAEYKDLDSLGQALIEKDVEIDIEAAGMMLEGTKKLYLNQDMNLLYGVDLYEVVKDPKGEEKSRDFYKSNESNVNTEIPIRMTGKLIPKEKVIKMFVFARKYQIKHVDGLTYDFLFEIAKNLQEKNALMFMGAGQKGNEPLIFTEGGSPYRTFLEGRVDGSKYCLILHLTNLELKELMV